MGSFNDQILEIQNDISRLQLATDAISRALAKLQMSIWYRFPEIRDESRGFTAKVKILKDEARPIDNKLWDISEM